MSDTPIVKKNNEAISISVEGIVVPYDILHNSNLNAMDKLAYGVIFQNSAFKSEGIYECILSNSDLALHLCVLERSLRKILARLCKRGLILVYYELGGNRVIEIDDRGMK